MLPTVMIYTAERARTRAEQRATDARVGELAAAFGQLGSSLMALPSRAFRRLAGAD
jgi:hypothetical protein